MPDNNTKTTDPRMHTAEHILSGTMVMLHGCGRPFTTHLEKRKSKADYSFSRNLVSEEIAAIEQRVNDVVARDLPVHEQILDRAAAAELFDLTRLPDAAGELVRVVHVGDYDACPCSGLHVKSTREIGRFRIVSTSHEAGALRIRFRLIAQDAPDNTSD